LIKAVACNIRAYLPLPRCNPIFWAWDAWPEAQHARWALTEIPNYQLAED
jgi:hypothetical protein